jgi:hypothetical protein
MKEKFGCVALIVVGLLIWIGLVHGCQEFRSWQLKRRLQQEDKGEYKAGRVYAPPRRDRHRCGMCGKYREGYYCEMCGKYYCGDCYSDDIAITHEGKVPID